MPMKNTSANLFYSYDAGLVHFVSYNTETYFNMTGQGASSGDGNDCVKAQYNWMRDDLAAVNRESTPWIVAYGHRPMYCNVPAHNATTNTTGCDGEQEQSRNGATGLPGSTSGAEPGSSDFAIEDLLFEYGVDLAFYGHVHDYTRYLPAYNDSVTDDYSSDLSNYTNPSATVHFTVGGAGNPEMTDSPTGCSYYDGTGWAPWAAVTAGPYGSCTDVNFGRAVVYNASHLHYQQVSVTSRGVIDDLWIVQERHGSFKNRTAGLRNS